ARGLEGHAVAADRSLHTAPHDHLFGYEGTRDGRPLADDDALSVDVALDLALDLHLALGLQIARDGEVRADDRGRSTGTGAGGRPRARRLRRYRGGPQSRHRRLDVVQEGAVLLWPLREHSCATPTRPPLLPPSYHGSGRRSPPRMCRGCGRCLLATPVENQAGAVPGFAATPMLESGHTLVRGQGRRGQAPAPRLREDAMRDYLWAAVTAALLATVAAGAARAEIAASSNDAKVKLVNGKVEVQNSPPADTVTFIDLRASPPKVLAEIEAPGSVVGPPLNIAISPKEDIALVSSNMRIDPADPTKQVPDDKVTVIDLAPLKQSLVGRIKSVVGAKAAPATPKVIATLQAGKGPA